MTTFWEKFGGEQTMRAVVSDFVEAALGGPYPYRGRTLRDIHRGMRISNAEFTAFTVHFAEALRRNGVGRDLVALASTMTAQLRSDIVEDATPVT